MRLAPGIQLSFVKLDNMQQGQTIDAGIDLRVGPDVGGGDDAHQRVLYADHMVCLGWQENDRFDNVITLEQLATANLIGGEGGLLPHSLLAGSISDVVRRRGFAVTTNSLASLPGMLVGSDLLALTPSWLAQYYAAFHPLKLISLPSDFDERIPVLAQWHPRHADDPAIAWLLDQMEASAIRLGAAASLAQTDPGTV